MVCCDNGRGSGESCDTSSADGDFVVRLRRLFAGRVAALILSEWSGIKLRLSPCFVIW